MPRHATKPAIARVCGHCKIPLKDINKTKPPRCFNRADCDSRAKAKLAERSKKVEIEEGTPIEGISFEALVDVICEHFEYSDARRADFLDNGSVKGYLRPRYILIHLLISLMKMSHETAAGCINRDRKMASAANVEIVTNYSEYSFDIEVIKRLLRLRQAEAA